MGASKLACWERVPGARKRGIVVDVEMDGGGDGGEMDITTSGRGPSQ